MKKLISLLLLVLISQSCVVYQKTPSTLNEAVEAKPGYKSVRIKYKKGEVIDAYRLVQKDSLYYYSLVRADDMGMGRGRLIRHNGDTLKFYNINLADSVYYVKMRNRVKNTEGNYDWIDSQEVIDQSMVKSINLNNQIFKEKEFVINEADVESINLAKLTISRLLTFGLVSSLVVIGMAASFFIVLLFA